MMSAETEAPLSLVSPENIEWLCKLAKSSPESGCFVEVGVYKGGAAWHLAKVAQEQGRSIFLYDTFTGIPFKDEIDGHNVGDFSDTDVQAVRAAVPYATVVQGLFPEEIRLMPPVAFAHIDVDQYRSTRDAVLALKPLMLPGGIMVFDDYGCLNSATVAIDEIFGDALVAHNAPKAYVVL